MVLALLACTTSEPQPDSVTWTEDVRPLIDAHCATCHGDGGLSFPLDTYDRALAVAPAMADSVADRRMPPFLADNTGECTTYSPARWLTEEEIDTVVAWVDAGSPEGPEIAREEPPEVEQLEPTHVLIPDQPYTPEVGGDDDWRCFVVEPDLDEDLYLTGYQVVPENPGVVHHVAIFKPISGQASEMVRAMDPDGAGYSCFGGANAPAGLWAIWSPGRSVYRLPEGTGVPLEAGVPLVVQVHYAEIEGDAPSELTEVRVELTDEAKPLMPLWLLNDDFELAPDTAHAEDSQDQTLYRMMLELGWSDYATGDVLLHGVGGHMHLMGTSLRAEVRPESGEDACLMDIRRWDYDWHDIYMLEDPVRASSADTIHIDCSWDTTGREEPVYWGDNLEDEMCTILVLAEPIED